MNRGGYVQRKNLQQCINSSEDLDMFNRSNTCKVLLNFFEKLNGACEGKDNALEENNLEGVCLAVKNVDFDGFVQFSLWMCSVLICRLY